MKVWFNGIYYNHWAGIFFATGMKECGKSASSLRPLFWALYFPYSMSKECFLTGHLQHTWNYIYIALISLIDSLLCLSKVHLVHTQFQGCHITYTVWYKTAIRDLPTVRSLIVILELLTVLLVYINLSIIW